MSTSSKKPYVSTETFSAYLSQRLSPYFAASLFPENLNKYFVSNKSPS